MSRDGVAVDDAIDCCCCHCCWATCPFSFVQCVCMPLPSRSSTRKQLHTNTHTHAETQTLARCIVISGRVAGTLSGNSCLCSCLPPTLGKGGRGKRFAVGLEKMCKGILQFSLDIFSAKWPKGTFFLAVSFYHYYFYSAVAAQCCQLGFFSVKCSFLQNNSGFVILYNTVMETVWKILLLT